MNENTEAQSGGCMTVVFWIAVSIWIMVALVVVLDVSGVGQMIDDAVGLGNEALYIFPMLALSAGGAVLLSRRFRSVPKVVMLGVPGVLAIGWIALTIWG